jgi:hypothetical protein
MLRKLLLGIVLAFIGVVASSVVTKAASITFPVIGESSFTNDYNSPRANGCHCATDIIASKGQQIVSATDGVVDYVAYPQPSWGYAVIVRSTAGNYYGYLHINNDVPGTDNGQGGGMYAYAPDIKVGNPIKRGQLIGWVGDSGNAEGTVPHLHFEIHDDSRNGPTMNPYHRLMNDSSRISKPINPPALPNEILPYGSGYKRTVNVARADVTGDGIEDLITGAEGVGSRPKVHVYNPSTKTRLGNFYALSDTLSNGVDVAAGDVDGDGTNEVITGLKAGEDAKVAIYRYNRDVTDRFEKVSEFVAYTGNNAMRVTAGDLDGDGKDEIITGTGPGVQAVLRVFDGDGNILMTHNPVGAFTGGIDVAAGDIESSLLGDEIALAPLTIGSSRTKVYGANLVDDILTPINDFYAYGSDYRGGIRLSIGEVDNDNLGYEIATIPNNHNRSVFRTITSSGEKTHSYIVLEEWWLGYYDVAASRDGTGDYSLGTGGNRRGSVR